MKSVTTQAAIAESLGIQISWFNRMLRNGKWSKAMSIQASESSGIDVRVFLTGTKAEIHAELEQVYGPFRATYDD